MFVSTRWIDLQCSQARLFAVPFSSCRINGEFKSEPFENSLKSTFSCRILIFFNFFCFSGNKFSIVKHSKMLLVWFKNFAAFRGKKEKIQLCVLQEMQCYVLRYLQVRKRPLLSTAFVPFILQASSPFWNFNSYFLHQFSHFSVNLYYFYFSWFPFLLLVFLIPFRRCGVSRTGVLAMNWEVKRCFKIFATRRRNFKFI